MMSENVPFACVTACCEYVEQSAGLCCRYW